MWPSRGFFTPTHPPPPPSQIWRTRVSINAIIILLNAFVLVSLIVTNWAAPDLTAVALGPSIIQDIPIVFVGGLLYTFTPFLLTIMHSWQSFRTLVWAFPAFLVFLPTILCDFFAYSIAKLDELSWGTKSGGQSSLFSDDAVSARAVRDGRVRQAAVVNCWAVGQLALFGILVGVNMFLMSRVDHFLIIQGLVTGLVSLTIMASAFLYYATLAAGNVVSALLAPCRACRKCSKSWSRPEEEGIVEHRQSPWARRAINWVDDVFRVATFAMWLVTIVCWFYDAIVT